MNPWHQRTGLNLYSYLARLFHKVDCGTVVEQLQQNHELLLRMVGRFPFRLPPCVDEDDLCQEIAESLLCAMRTYDPMRGNLEEHLQHNVVRHIRQWARRLNPLGQRRPVQMQAVNEAWLFLAQRHQRAPTVEELADETCFPVYVVQRVLDAMEMRDVISLDQVADEVDLPEEGSDPLESVCVREGTARLSGLLCGLSPRERDLLRLHYGEGFALREVAERLGQPKSTVIDLHRQVLLRLRGELTAGRPARPRPPRKARPAKAGRRPVLDAGEIPYTGRPYQPGRHREQEGPTWWARVGVRLRVGGQILLKVLGNLNNYFPVKMTPCSKLT